MEGIASDINQLKEKKKRVRENVDNTILHGMVVGSGVTVCITGILQFVHNMEYLSKEIVQRYWFQVPWWTWICGLIFFVSWYLYTRRKAHREFDQEIK